MLSLSLRVVITASPGPRAAPRADRAAGAWTVGHDIPRPRARWLRPGPRAVRSGLAARVLKLLPHPLVEGLRRPARNAQRLPGARLVVLGENHDLPDVRRRVSVLPIDRRHHGHRLVACRHGPLEVGRREAPAPLQEPGPAP